MDADVAGIIYEALINGFNGTMLVYGQTGSGKTHTMFGPGGVAADDEVGHGEQSLDRRRLATSSTVCP